MVDSVQPGTNNVLQLKTTVISRIKTLNDHLNPNVLHQKYIVEKLSASQIAGLTGASKTAVLESLRRMDIPRRPSHKPHGRLANPPFGFHIVAGKLVKHHKEQRVIEIIKKMYLTKEHSLKAIARKLNLDGVPTKTGKGKWFHEQVRAILKREKLKRRTR